MASASGLVFYYARQYDHSLEQFQRARALNPDAPGVHRHLGLALSQLGRHADAIAELQQAARLSRDWYEKALQTREEPLVWVKVSPHLAGLRGDARYEALLRKLGLAGAQARAQ